MFATCMTLGVFILTGALVYFMARSAFLRAAIRRAGIVTEGFTFRRFAALTSQAQEQARDHALDYFGDHI